MRFKVFWRRLVTQLYWRIKLSKIGYDSVIFKPIDIIGANKIIIGSNVFIRDGARIEVLKIKSGKWNPKLEIGSNVNIEQGVHIICQCSVVIHDDVSITPYCVIVDTYHPFEPPDKFPKIGERLPDCPTFVSIGKGSFIGAHSIILSNVKIGKGCVIGAGSVVSCDIPDYSVAAGIPARVIKTFDIGLRIWVST
jgi:acetyltransferase-like isoleucine patch superfamily enzyme